MSKLNVDNLIRVIKIITSAAGSHTIDHVYISAAMRIINPSDLAMYDASALDTWITYQAKKIPNVHFNVAKAMLNKDGYRVKTDAVAYLSGILIVHEDYIK